MPRVDFYILPDALLNGRLLFACRLTEKAHSLGHPVYLHTASSRVAEHLNHLLWTYREDSFLPHCLMEERLLPVPPILIDDERGPEARGTPLEETLTRMHTLLCPITDMPPWEGPAAPGVVLINLATTVPVFFEQFTRIAEIVDQDQQNLTTGRARFIFYRDRGIHPENHKLPATPR
ncbi:DNA polymerase III subunit chi [Gammaproteobacteria bacterium]